MKLGMRCQKQGLSPQQKMEEILECKTEYSMFNGILGTDRYSRKGSKSIW
jgi:hypothetical protein